MNIVRAALRRCFDAAEAGLGWVFQPAWNPLLNLGALGFMFYWIITVSGIYVYIFFDTGVHNAYESIEYMTHEQWYLAGIMRSLHRYASDALVIVMLLHLVREFARDRYRGVRWFSWVTGVPVLVMVYFAGISGYWLVWTSWRNTSPSSQPNGSTGCRSSANRLPATSCRRMRSRAGSSP